MREFNCISFCGGVQSTAMVLMAIKGDMPMPDAVIFADTQSEPEWVYDTVLQVSRECEGAELPFYTVTAGNLMQNTLEALDGDGCGHIGQPPLYTPDMRNGGKEGRLWRKCTTDYKIRPFLAKVRELMGISRATKNMRIVQWLGITLDEVQRAKSSEPPYVRRYPLLEKRMTRHDCQNWLAVNGYPIPRKSACIMCPFRSDKNWLELKQHAPADWDAAVKWDAALRAGGKLLPGVRNPAYVHRSLVPLGEVVFDAMPGQLDLFQDECEGVCGV